MTILIAFRDCMNQKYLEFLFWFLFYGEHVKIHIEETTIFSEMTYFDSTINYFIDKSYTKNLVVCYFCLKIAESLQSSRNQSNKLMEDF